MTPPPVTPGHDDQWDRCGATTRGGGACQQIAGWGTDHPGEGRCKLHGGSTPAHRTRAQRLALAATARTMGVPRDVDPHTALLEMLALAAGAADYLGALVHALETGELYGPVGGAHGARPSYEPDVLIRMWQTERGEVARVAAACVKAGVQQRQVELAEQQGALIAARFRLLVQHLGLKIDDPKVRAAVRASLTTPLEGPHEAA